MGASFAPRRVSAKLQNPMTILDQQQPSSSSPLPLSPEAAASAGNSGKWLVLFAAFLGWMFDGLEMGIFPQISRPALTELLKNSADFQASLGWWNQFIAAMFLWGAAVGGLLFGYLG